MRIGIVALDTRGGVQPYAALALGLTDAAHDVRLAVPADFVDELTSRGLRAIPVAGSSEAMVRTAGLDQMGTLARTRFVREQTLRHIRRAAVETRDAFADIELVTGGVGGMVVGEAVAELLGVPFVFAYLQPIGPPTGAFPGVLVPGAPSWMGSAGRRLSHVASQTALQLLLRPAAREARVEVLGLPRRPEPVRTDLPVLYGFSAHVVPAPPEWGSRRHVTGYWTLPPPVGWSPPAALESFVADGPPPVCIGFGSMASKDPASTTALVREAVVRAGVRAVLLTGSGGMDADADTGQDSVVTADAVPHEWLYPRMAAVVHHGGAGTTGAALRAGVPAVVVPFGMDQRFWAARVAALDVSRAAIPRRRLTAAALAEALRATVADRAMGERARVLGARIRAEDGVARAVSHYDRVVRRAA